MIIALPSGNYLKVAHRRNPERALRQFEAGDALMGFRLRNDYNNVLRFAASPERSKTFTWDKGDAILTRTPNGGAQLVVHERGRPEVSIPLKRE